MSIFLSIKELMFIEGYTTYKAAQRRHQSIRESIGSGKKKLTIREYCKIEQLDYDEIWELLR